MKEIHIVTHFREKNNPSTLLTYAKKLDTKLTGNLKYPGIINPTLVIYEGHILTLENAITAWGTPSNHGTSQQHQDLIDAVKIIHTDINGLKHFCENKTPNDGDGFLSAGWEISEATPGSVGVLPAPAGLHVILQNHVVIPGRIHYGWDLVRGAHAYKVWTGTGALPTVLPPDVSLPYQTVTHGHFDDVAPSGTSRWIIVGCIGTDQNTAYATMSGTIVP